VRGSAVLARALLGSEATGSKEAIEAALVRALEVVGETGGKLEPAIRLELAELARLAGDDTARERDLRAAHRLFTEMGATARAEQVAKELERRFASIS
jgi:hypothetical protein